MEEEFNSNWALCDLIQDFNKNVSHFTQNLSLFQGIAKMPSNYRPRAMNSQLSVTSQHKLDD